MNKEALIQHIQTYIAYTDGYYSILTGESFQKLLKIEHVFDENVILISESAVEKEPNWKDKISDYISALLKKHQDLFVVFKKYPNGEGDLEGFLFDAIIFNEITPKSVSDLRLEFNEDKNGLYTNNKKIFELSEQEVSPYYTRLLPIKNHSNKKGRWVLRKYYN